MQQEPTVSKPKDLQYLMPEFQQYQGGNLTVNPVQYQQNQNFKDSLDKIGQMVNGPQAENQYLTKSGEAFNRVMDPTYKAYSDEDINRQFDRGKQQLSEDYFKINREQAARNAATGMTGSGTAQVGWNALNKGQSKALTDFYQNLQDKNTEATRQDRSQAFGMMPQLAGLQNQINAQPLQNQMAWNSLLGGENQAQNQMNMFNAGQSNQANQANWQRLYDIWNTQNQWNMQNAQGQNAVNQANNQMAWQQYLESQKNKKSGGLGSLLGGVAGFLAGGPAGAGLGSNLGSNIRDFGL